MDLDAWKIKRNRTIKTYLFFEVVAGIDYTLIPITIIPYLKQLVREDELNYFYSLESMIGYIVSAIAGMIISRIIDRTRNVKYSMNFVLTCTIIGHVMYTLRVSPYFIVAARALCGTLPAQGYVLTGEIIRCFEEEEASKVLWWYTTATTIGYIIGSWISLSFVSINFQLGDWKIDRDNFAGLFLLALCILNLLSVYLFTYDCSKEYDLKSFAERAVHLEYDTTHDLFTRTIELTPTADDQENVDEIPSNAIENEPSINVSSHDSIFTVLKKFIRSLDVMLILSSSFLYAAVGFTTDLMSPIVILEILKWDSKYLNIQQGLSAFAMTLSSLLLSKYAVSSMRIYIASILTILSSFSSIVLLIVITQFNTTTKWDIVLIVLYSVAIVPIWYLDSPLFASMLGRMVKTDIQSFAESCRSLFTLSSCVVVGIFIATNGFLKYLLFGLSGLIIIVFFVFVYRRKKFMNIKLVIS